jgi:hypothetical protein
MDRRGSTDRISVILRRAWLIPRASLRRAEQRTGPLPAESLPPAGSLPAQGP